MVKNIVEFIEGVQHILHVGKPFLVDLALFAMLIWELLHFLEKAIVG
jgi:hypothetical protein